MSAPLSIALVSPHAWPAHDDLTWRIDSEASALARRGHRVTILAPVQGRGGADASRRILSALREGDLSAALADPATVLVVPIGRGFSAGRRTLSGPIDLSAALQDVLTRVPYDVVHVHEPLAPTPALAALRHSTGVTAATFHREEQVAGVAFVRPLVERAIGRLDVVTAASDTVRRAVAEMFERDAVVIPDAADITRFAPDRESAASAPDIVVIARGGDRLGVRFAGGVLKALDPDDVGTITVLGPSDAHWRTTAALPSALRHRVTAYADEGPGTRERLFHTGAIAIVATPQDLAGSVVSEACARGMVVVAPRCPESASILTDDVTGIILPPFSRDAWSEGLRSVVDAPDRRARISAAAIAMTQERNSDTVAATLESHYRAAIHRGRPHATTTDERGFTIVDCRVRPGPQLSPREIAQICTERGVDAVAVIGDQSIHQAQQVQAAASGDLTVIVGQQIHTGDGELVGLFLTEPVKDGLPARETAEAIHAQRALVMVPHPIWGEPPPADVLATMRDLCDCYEIVVGPASTLRASITSENARVMQRMGLRVTAGSGASTAEGIGSSYLRMPPFASPDEFVLALDDAVPTQRRRGLRARPSRERRRPPESAK